jgi:4'-phosphopantetheinyl transferase
MLKTMWNLPSVMPSLRSGEVHLWSALCVPILDDLGALRHLLTPSEQERADRLATGVLRRRYLQAHALLHILLRAYLETGEYELAYRTHGKPFLRVLHMNHQLEFNMSHSGDYLSIALARGFQVGVDVELVRPLSDLESLIEECCTQREKEYMSTLPINAHLMTFYQLWTRKEALLKMQGIGLGEKLSTVEVYDGVKEGSLIDLAPIRAGGHNYVGALALPEFEIPPKLTYFSARWDSARAETLSS